MKLDLWLNKLSEETTQQYRSSIDRTSSSLQESSLGVPYDVSVDYIVKDGKKRSVVKNKNGVGHLPKAIIEEGDSYEIESFHEIGNGQISFTIESYDDSESQSWRYSILSYDSKKSAIKDGWRL